MAGPTSNLPQISIADKTVAVMAVSPFEEDHASLRAIFSHSNWRISSAYSCHEAVRQLHTSPLAVLICERDLPDGTWKDLLESVTLLPFPPLIVVSSSHADDRLWAEVLNLGAYDVLSKPFDRAEVTRIVSLAWLHWKDLAAARRKLPVAEHRRASAQATA